MTSNAVEETVVWQMNCSAGSIFICVAMQHKATGGELELLAVLLCVFVTLLLHCLGRRGTLRLIATNSVLSEHKSHLFIDFSKKQHKQRFILRFNHMGTFQHFTKFHIL